MAAKQGSFGSGGSSPLLQLQRSQWCFLWLGLSPLAGPCLLLVVENCFPQGHLQASCLPHWSTSAGRESWNQGLQAAPVLLTPLAESCGVQRWACRHEAFQEAEHVQPGVGQRAWEPRGTSCSWWSGVSFVSAQPGGGEVRGRRRWGQLGSGVEGSGEGRGEGRRTHFFFRAQGALLMGF